MSYAIFNLQTNKIEKDENGNLHVYSTQEQATNVCDLMNYNKQNPAADDLYKVKPV